MGIQNGWFIMENPNLKWMITGGTPILGKHHLMMIFMGIMEHLMGFYGMIRGDFHRDLKPRFDTWTVAMLDCKMIN